MVFVCWELTRDLEEKTKRAKRIIHLDIPGMGIKLGVLGLWFQFPNLMAKGAVIHGRLVKEGLYTQVGTADWGGHIYVVFRDEKACQETGSSIFNGDNWGIKASLVKLMAGWQNLINYVL